MLMHMHVKMEHVHVSLLGNAGGSGRGLVPSSDHWKRLCSRLPMTQTVTDTGLPDLRKSPHSSR